MSYSKIMRQHPVFVPIDSAIVGAKAVSLARRDYIVAFRSSKSNVTL